MRKPVSYLVDRIFPTKEVHIIAGASGVGKTTFTFQMIDEWRKGGLVLGYKAIPCPFVYVSCDRSEQSVETTLERIGLSIEDIPFLDGRGFSGYDKHAVGEILFQARKVNPEVKVLFIEAFSLMVPQSNFKDSYRNTAEFLSGMTKEMEKENLTIIGTAHSPKQRENDQITDPRQLVLGTVAWGAFVETIIAIRRVAPKDPNNQKRQVLLLPRNAREQAFEYNLDDDGRFVIAELTSSEDVLAIRLESIPYDRTITTAEILRMADDAGMPERTAYNWKDQAVADGRLIKVSKGIYRRGRKQ